MLFDGLSPATIITRIITLLIAFTFHEFSHAWTADRLGDDTPRLNGRLTLNPIAHLDIIGTLLLLLRGFGWARPVPVNPYALARRSPAALMWVSLAGPMSNLLMAVVAAIPLRLGLVPVPFGGSSYLPTAYDFLWEFMIINLVLMLFNLIPIAPLDGEKIAEYFFPPPLSRLLETIRPYGPIILIAVVFVPPQFGFDVIGWIMGPALTNILRLLVGG
ncbi:MAG TPA: site-2 protease family protein [Anaerolineaceae bacterium]|nr:site-2 protease family protein [Anaerolineaceae bacterium]